MSISPTESQVEIQNQDTVWDNQEELESWAFSGSPTPYSFSHWDEQELEVYLEEQNIHAKNINLNPCLTLGKLIDNKFEQGQNVRVIEIIKKVVKQGKVSTIKIPVKSRRCFRDRNFAQSKPVISVKRSYTHQPLGMVEKKRSLLKCFQQANDSPFPEEKV